MELDEAANKRFFLMNGLFSNKELGQVLRKNFPDHKDLPGDKTPGGEYPEEGYAKYDNSRSKKVLGIEYHPFETTIVDTAKSLQAVGA